MTAENNTTPTIGKDTIAAVFIDQVNEGGYSGQFALHPDVKDDDAKRHTIAHILDLEARRISPSYAVERDKTYRVRGQSRILGWGLLIMAIIAVTVGVITQNPWQGVTAVLFLLMSNFFFGLYNTIMLGWIMKSGQHRHEREKGHAD